MPDLPTESEIRTRVRSLADEIAPAAPDPDRALRRAKRRLARNALASMVVAALALYGSVSLIEKARRPDQVRPVVAPSGRSGLWIVDPSSGRSNPLPWSRPFDTTPAWSPDGRFLAFARSDDGRQVLHVADLRRGTTRRLPAAIGVSPSWSPDGGKLAFTSYLPQEGVSLFDLDRRVRRRVVDGRHPAFTPDGAGIIYECDRPTAANPSNTAICRIDLASGQSGTLIDSTHDERRPSVGRDGRIVYELGVDGGGVSVQVAQPDGSSARRLATGFYPVWGRDGRVVYRGDRNLFRIDPGDGTALRLTFDPTSFDDWPAATQVSDRIVYEAIFDKPTELFVMNGDGNATRRMSDLGRVNGGAVMSPDRKWIVFASTRDGFAAIYRMSADGSDLRRLTNDPEGAVRPVFSADSATIAFTRTGLSPGAPRGIWLMNVDGTGMRPLEGAEDGRNPSFAPDGTGIAFAEGSSVFLIDGGRKRLVARDADLPAFGPGGRIAYIRHGAVRDDVWVANGYDPSSPPRLLGSPPGREKLAPWWGSGPEIVYHTMGEIYAIHPQTGATRMIAGPGNDYGPSWTPDGRILFNSDR